MKISVIGVTVDSIRRVYATEEDEEDHQVMVLRTDTTFIEVPTVLGVNGYNPINEKGDPMTLIDGKWENKEKK